MLIHEIFHYLLRLNYIGKIPEEALTPPSIKNLGINKGNGKIGEQLILYYFNRQKISQISYEAAKTFISLDLSNALNVKKLKTILDICNSKENFANSRAKFCTNDDYCVVFEFGDCRELPSSV